MITSRWPSNEREWALHPPILPLNKNRLPDSVRHAGGAVARQPPDGCVTATLWTPAFTRLCLVAPLTRIRLPTALPPLARERATGSWMLAYEAPTLITFASRTGLENLICGIAKSAARSATRRWQRVVGRGPTGRRTTEAPNTSISSRCTQREGF
jgi:hypothetical protein